ncbi:ThuA domain-containing protein [Flavitalea flava]
MVFTKTAGYHHSSIAAGVPAIQKLGVENNFDVDTTSDAGWIQEDTLQKYAAVVFLNTTGNLLNNYQEADFERYIQAGGGWVGVHAATDAEYDWGWYGRLAGAWFNGHPAQQEAVIKVIDAGNPATKHLPATWKRKDEWYNFKNLNKDVHVLLAIDEKSYEGGTNGDNHPMAWFHEYDGGRAWYTELGHTEESYTEPNYLKHLLGGIEYAIAENKKLDYSKVKTLRVPEEGRFTRTQLVTGVFFEPTEMTILPNLDILITQRRGEIMLYKNETKTVKQAGFLHAYFKTLHTPNVNAEEGVLGIQADPDFKTNHFVYIYYSPADTSVNRLSRFTLTGDTIDNKSEKIVLQLYSQREICCHTGGSIAFGPDNNLFVSTGDNSTPFDEPNTPYPSHGYGPMDDRPGHTQYDSRRGAGNTNDLRGKILRIKINPDGSYGIPEGNLFPGTNPKTRPEIYVMGNRNPYRIAVDKKNGYLYWGEVGPDANNDSLDTRGPKGYDEVNQARKAGFFGWPLFVGNNYPYHLHNYETGENGPVFDAAHPINDSRNNTGLRELPPAQPAFVWYPYGNSPEFPQVGAGGRCAMAGPVYYSDLYPAETRFPDYYNGKFIMYEWIRGWFKAVTMLPNGDFDKMEPFLENTRFNAPVDVEMGPDGRMYVLEYGNGWFTKNADAGLSRVDYNSGNIAPKISGITVNKISGLLPLDLELKVDAKDVENDAMTYTWDLGDGTKKETTVPALNYAYNKAGEFAISVEVKDAKGAVSKSETVHVYAGNEIPSVSVSVKGNQTFYFPGRPVNYTVNIRDKTDTAQQKDPADLVVTADYTEGLDKAATSQGHQVLSAAAEGKNIMLSLDCKTCHKVSEKSIGPAYTEVAKRYQKDPEMVSYLVQKITKGGSGKWGEVAMPGHPAVKEEDIRQIVGWIQTLSADNKTVKSLPASGTVDPTNHQPIKDKGVLTISASFTNKGINNTRPLTGSGSYSLWNSHFSFGKGKYSEDGITLGPIDMTGISQVEIGIDGEDQPTSPFVVEWFLDSAGGKKLGAIDFPAKKKVATNPAKPAKSNGDKPDAPRPVQIARTTLAPVGDGQQHKLYIKGTVKSAVPSNEGIILFYNKFIPK